MSEIRTDTINNASGDNDSGIDLSTNDKVVIKTANTTALTVDASQNVGIGITGPTVKLDIVDDGVQLRLANSTTGTTTADGSRIQLSGNDLLLVNRESANMQFYTADTEHMRILSNGDIAINSTTTNFGTFSAAHLRIDTDSSKNGVFVTNHRQNQSAYVVHADNNTGIRYALYMVNGSGGEAGKITYTNTTVTYATTSDHRLKENVTADWDATTRLKQLNPVRFNFIADADTTVDGFLAHEVQSVVPEAITGTHNEVDDDGNPVYQGIDQSKLVPLLVKTIQELEARITALENE